AFIVDDEPLARATLRCLLAKDPEIAGIGECADGALAVERIRAEDPDLVFLDVSMPGLGGFELLDALGPERRAAIVFVTAYDEHALRAFDASARDYLLKPFDDERFARALGRAKEAVRRARMEDVVQKLGTLLGRDLLADPIKMPPAREPLERLVVRAAGSVTVIDVAEIDYIEAEDYYVLLHAGTKHVLYRESMRDLEAMLPRSFVRIHRSTIVNAERIVELRTHASGEHRVILRGGTELGVSRTRRHQVSAMLTAR
ncbi:MAG TPA: LytTR family transcriptional regulator DNA-binding domain-containing protein, partial [Polyangiaceae bacterium]|nr:LytTR family transcriptional regulator DNA-binding domain-containing protein [Polyangiaceae bacterium]